MKIFTLLLALAVVAPAPAAQAAWAIAIVKGGNPIVDGNDHLHTDRSANAIASCNTQFNTHACRIIAKGDNSCVALANNGVHGSHIRWTAGQGNTLPRADLLAMQSCTALNAGSCTVVHHFCR